MKLFNSDAMCFDDVLLVPNEGAVESRKNVSLRMDVNGIMMGLPVFAAPMDTVCEWEMARAMAERGGLGIIHRYMSIGEQCQQVQKASDDHYAVGAAVGAKGDFLDDAAQLHFSGAGMLLVDTANGHSQYAVDAVKTLRDYFSETPIHIMAGNVATWDGFFALAQAGADSVRVGIGGGSACTTRGVTGHGLPTLSSIMEIQERRERMAQHGVRVPTAIVADGGIRSTSDMVKAFAAGADAVMVGSMLAGTDESPGEVENGRKQFRGMASADAQRAWRGHVGGAEGISTTVPVKGSVRGVLDTIVSGISSGCSYSGVEHLSDLASVARYAKVSPASLAETRPHAKEA